MMRREWFSLDGVRCDDLGIAMLGYTAQLIPQQDVDTTRVRGMDSEYERFPGSYRARTFTIRCALLSEDEIDLAEKTKNVGSWLSGKKKLVLWDRSGITYGARYADSPRLDNQALWGEFELLFSCDPAGVGLERTAPVGVTFKSFGNVDSPCAVRLVPQGQADGIAVSHAKGTVRILATVRAGQSLLIDGVRRIVTLDGQSIMPEVDVRSDWPVIVPGANTISANTAVEGTVRFAERWI